MIVQSRDGKVTLEDSYGIPEITTLLLWGERSVADLGLRLVLTTDYNWAESLINSVRQLLSQWGLTLSKQQFKIDCYFQSSVVSSVSGPLINIQVFKVSHNQHAKITSLQYFIDSYLEHSVHISRYSERSFARPPQWILLLQEGKTAILCHVYGKDCL